MNFVTKEEKFMLKEMILETPEIKGILIRSGYNSMDFIGLIEVLVETKEIGTEENVDPNEVLLKKAIKAFLEIMACEEENDTYEKLVTMHKFFDVLLMEETLITQELTKYQFRSFYEEELFELYFELLKEFKEECIKNGVQGKYVSFCLAVKPKIDILQKVFAIVIKNKTVELFSDFATQIAELENSESTDVVEYQRGGLIRFQKLPALSKMKKTDIKKLLTMINVYSYEDAMKLLDYVYKKYKVEDIFGRNTFVKYGLMKGEGVLEGIFQIIFEDYVISENKIHPQYPYFPFKAKNLEQLFEEIIVYANEYFEDELRKILYLRLVETLVRKYNPSYPEITDNDKKYEEVCFLIIEAVLEKFPFDRNWVERGGSIAEWGDGEKGNFGVEIEGIKYGIKSLKNFLNPEKLIFSTGSYSKKEYSYLPHSISAFKKVEETKREGLFNGGKDVLYKSEIRDIYNDVLTCMRKLNHPELSLKIEEAAEWFDFASIYGTNNFESKIDFFVDVLKFQIINGKINVRVARILSGERYSNYSNFEGVVLEEIRQESDDFHYKIVEGIVNQLKEEYESKKIVDLVDYMRRGTGLNCRSRILLLIKLKPKVMMNYFVIQGIFKEGEFDIIGEVDKWIKNLTDEESVEIWEKLKC